MSEQKTHQEKTLRELAMDAYEDILHAETQIAMVQKHIPHLYPKLYEECERAHAGVSHALNLAHKVLSAASDAEKAPAGKSEDDGMARTLLSWVDRNRKELQAMRAMGVAYEANVAGLFSTLLDDTEELCKWQIGDPRRAIFTIGLEYGKGKYYDEVDRLGDNCYRVLNQILNKREQALQEAAMRLFLATDHQPYSFNHCATEQLDGYFARKYIWRDIRPKHIRWLENARGAGFIDTLIIDYEPEQEK